MTALEDALADVAGSVARVRQVLLASLDHGRDELALPRSGSREAPVEVALAADAGAVLALVPLDAQFRADPAVAPDRAWVVAAAAVGALAEVAELPPVGRSDELALAAGSVGGHLLLRLPARGADAELAALAFDEAVGDVDRLRAGGRPVPAAVLAPDGDLRPPLDAVHPLRRAEAVARLGGHPAGHDDEALDEAVLAVLAPDAGPASPHHDPDPARRVARRIVQRLAGMGKWGGYHTEWAHLARGFAGHDRELAYAVGERLVEAGLLGEKPSVGQRHVFLNPQRAGDVYALIERGTLPSDLQLP